MSRLPSIEPLEARIAPALVTVNPLADILLGAGQKTTTIELQDVVNDDADHPGRTLVKFSLNLDLDPNTVGLQNDTDLVTPGVQPPQVVIELYDDLTPLTVQNFLRYVENPDTAADFVGTFFHRAVTGFVLQGGGYNASNSTHIDTFPTVHNEFSPARSNVRGTVAMAKVGDDPNSATSEWFVNLADNSGNLDSQNGGFTVFGEVTSGMEYVDQIVALLGSITEGTPKQNTGLGGANDLITITGVTVERPTADATFMPHLQYHVDVSNVAGTNPIVIGSLTGSSLKLSYTGNAGIADVTVTITDTHGDEDPLNDEVVTDTFRVTAQSNLTTKILFDSFRGNLRPDWGMIVVPGERGMISVTVTNNGAVAYTGPIDFNVYHSKADGYTPNSVALGPDPKGLTLDSGVDDLIGHFHSDNVTIASGQTITVNIPSTITEQLSGGFDAYRLLAEVVASDTNPQMFADDKVALNGLLHGLVSEFGLVQSRTLGILLDSGAQFKPNAAGEVVFQPYSFLGLTSTKLSVKTSEGNLATFSITGAGTGKFTQSNGLTNLLVANTNGASILNLSSPDLVDLQNIDVSSPIGTVNLTASSVSGYMTFSSGVKVLNLGDLDAGDHHLILGSFNALNSVGATLNFGSVKNLSIESDQPITALNAREWLDSSGEADSILTPSLGKLNITGRASTGITDPGIAGDFEADLWVYTSAAVKSMNVKGALNDAAITTGGKIIAATFGSMADSSISASAIASLTVKGAVTDSALQSTGNLTKLNVGSMSGSSVETAGMTSFIVKGAMTDSSVHASRNVTAASLGAMFDSSFLVGTDARPTSLADFTDIRSIGTFTIKGIVGMPIAFSNAQVAAANIGKIIVKGAVDTGSTGDAFGFVADKVTSYQRGTTILTKLSAATVKDQQGEYSLTIL